MKKNSLFLRVFYLNLIFFIFNIFLFLTFPSFDIFFSGLFFIDGQFLDHHYLIIKTIRSKLKEILIFIPLMSLILLSIIFINKSQNIRRNNKKSLRRLKISLIGLIFGPIIGCGIIANLYFKDTWGRARPVQVEEFGGSKKFSPAMHKSDQCEKNCSWIGGETSAAFSLFVGIIMMKRAYIFIFINLILGSLVIFCRLAMGGHFLSDNLFAINFMIFLALIFKILALKCVKRNLVSKS
tara:strand:- start:162 stop:875 length:714 start_codon:yes stop_codon:yes gene_type:complete